MLLTTAVGGVGLNLTAADRVVLVDPVRLPRLPQLVLPGGRAPWVPWIVAPFLRPGILPLMPRLGC